MYEQHTDKTRYHQGIWTITSISGLNPFTVNEITQQLLRCLIRMMFITNRTHSAKICLYFFLTSSNLSTFEC